MTLFRGHCAFSENHFFQINIIVDSRKGFLDFQPQLFQNDLHHGFPVEIRELLGNFHIVEVLIKIPLFYPDQFRRELRNCPPLIQNGLNFPLTSLAFISAINSLVRAGGFSIERLLPLILIVFGNLHAKMTTSGVHHQIERAGAVLIHFDKVVAAAQSSDTLAGPLYVYMIGTIELFQRNFCLTCQWKPSDFHTAWNFLPDDFVQLLKMQLFLLQPDGFHPTADIHSHHIGMTRSCMVTVVPMVQPLPA